MFFFFVDNCLLSFDRWGKREVVWKYEEVGRLLGGYNLLVVWGEKIRS